MNSEDESVQVYTGNLGEGSSFKSSSSDEENSDIEKELDLLNPSDIELDDDDTKNKLIKQLVIRNKNYLMLRSIFSKEVKNINMEIKNLQDEIIDLTEQLEIVVPKPKKVDKLMDVKRNDITIKKDIMLKYINHSHIAADKQLFKYYYLNNKNPPIRRVSVTVYEFWADGEWHIDQQGKKIIAIVAHNLRKCWLRLRPGEDVDSDLFLSLQAHIEKLGKSDYHKILLQNITADLPLPH